MKCLKGGSPSYSFKREKLKNKPAVKKRKKKKEFQSDPDVYGWLIDSCSIGIKGKDYLVTKRGFQESTINRFNIKEFDNPSEKFEEAKDLWGLEKLFRCGLVKKKNNYYTFFPWWPNVLLFPFYGLRGEINYLVARQINDGPSRYINLANVETQIYNLNVLNSMAKGDTIYICEGITDTLAAYETGLNAVGILGAHGFKGKWAQLFSRFYIRVIPDNDESGNIFAKSIEEEFKRLGKSVQIIELKGVNDLTELVMKERNKRDA